MADVIPMPASLTVLADRIRVALDRAKTVDGTWVEATLEMVVAFSEARSRFLSDRQFSMWIAENSLDRVSRDDRAALINMSRDLEVARMVLEETKRKSWRLIWTREMEPLYRNDAKPEPELQLKRQRSRICDQAPAQPAKVVLTDGEAASRLTGGLDALVHAFDGLDLAAARRGMTLTQRRQVDALKRRIRNWLDVLEISK